MPIIFIGHGSPMNAIESNIYTESWKKIWENIEKPRAILMFSAHWITEWHTRISSNEHPEMIYDMYGFPPELYRVWYSAPGSREIAEEIMMTLRESSICHSERSGGIPFSSSYDDKIDATLMRWFWKGSLRDDKKEYFSFDSKRGFDHGVWSTLIHIFPNADVPIISMSLDYLASPWELYAIGASLAILRDRGILMMWSGNIVHNLGAIDWSGKHTYPWAVEFDKKVANLIESRDFAELLDFKNWWEVSRLAHPSYDHLLPLFPLLGASSLQDRVSFFTPDIVMGSLSMRSVRWG